MSDIMLRHITEDVNGKPVAFAKMSVRQRFSLLADVKAAKRKLHSQDILTAGVTQKQYNAEMKAFDARWNEADEWQKFVNSTEGQLKILDWSVNTQTPGAGEAVTDQLGEAGRMLEVVAKICGLELIPADPKTPKETGGDPDPTAGLMDTRCPTPGI